MNYNVQIGAFEELKILKKMVDCYGVSVKLALNSLYYTGEQYKEIAELIDACMQIGFDTFIIADPALILYLREQKISCNIHLSGECAEINSLFLAQIAKFDICRVIFHRKNSIAQMRACIVKCRGEIPEYEAFFLNEMCHFTGAYCNSFHCDEFAHLCHVPYELGNVDGRKKSSLAAAEERSGFLRKSKAWKPDWQRKAQNRQARIYRQRGIKSGCRPNFSGADVRKTVIIYRYGWKEAGNRCVTDSQREAVRLRRQRQQHICF